MTTNIDHQWDETHQCCSCGWKPDVPFHHMSHLHIEEPLFKGKPHGWIQWKGTDVCCDLHCICGENFHFDGDFMYFIRCSSCRRVWEVGTSIALYEVKDNRADGSIIKEGE